MELLDEWQAESVRGGHRSQLAARRQAPIAMLLRGLLGLSAGGALGRTGAGFGGSSTIETSANQINLAFNIVLNGGSVVNNQLNGLDLSVSA